MGDHAPYRNISAPAKLALPASLKLHNTSQHNPVNPKQQKDHIPQLSSNSAMET